MNEEEGSQSLGLCNWHTLAVNNWSKDSLNLQVGDQIIWLDAEIKSEDGPAIVSPGRKGKLITLRDGAHLDVMEGGAIPAKALELIEAAKKGDTVSIKALLDAGADVNAN